MGFGIFYIKIITQKSHTKTPFMDFKRFYPERLESNHHLISISIDRAVPFPILLSQSEIVRSSSDFVENPR